MRIYMTVSLKDNLNSSLLRILAETFLSTCFITRVTDVVSEKAGDSVGTAGDRVGAE